MVEKWKYDEICIKPPPTTLLNWIPQGPQPHPYALLRRFYVKTDLSERGVTFGHHGKNGSWTGPRRLWTPKPASWSRGRIQVDAKERHHQAPPCIKSRGNQERVNLHLKAERRLKGCNPSSGDPAHKPHQSVPTSPAPSRGPQKWHTHHPLHSLLSSNPSIKRHLNVLEYWQFIVNDHSISWISLMFLINVHS